MNAKTLEKMAEREAGIATETLTRLLGLPPGHYPDDVAKVIQGIVSAAVLQMTAVHAQVMEDRK